MQVKCKFCALKNERDEMAVIKKGKSNMYFHHECLKEFEQEETEKALRREKKDALYEAVKEIHEIQSIPRQLYPLIESLRLGENVGKKNTKGAAYEYDIIHKTYVLCKDKIQYAMRTKHFNNTLSLLNYTLSIVINNIETIVRQEHIKKMQEELVANHMKQDSHFSEEMERELYLKRQSEAKTKRKNKKKKDISRFLDDEGGVFK